MEKQAAKSNTTAATASQPVIIELGKQSKKRIRRLRRGQGRLMDVTLDTLEQLREQGSVAADAQPVLIIVQQKRKRLRWW